MTPHKNPIPSDKVNWLLKPKFIFSYLMKPPLLHSWNRYWVFAVALFTITLAAYQPAWNGKPIWDDDRHITRPELRSTGGLARIWTNPKTTAQYYPVMNIDHSTYLKIAVL